MKTKKPFRIADVDLNNILYSNLVTNNNKTNILLKYQLDNKQKQFIFQTPELVCKDTPILNNNIYEINIGLQAKTQKKINSLLNFINALDNKIEELGTSNNKWFNNKKRIYRKIIREDKRFPNGILKLKVKKNTIPKYLKVTKNKQMDPSKLEDIQNNYKIKLVIDIFGLWIRKRNNIYYYGVYLKPVLIDYQEEIVESISFIEDSDSDNVNEILDTEFEQQYDNTETSIMNIQSQNDVLKKEIDTIPKMSDYNDSIYKSVSLTIERYTPSPKKKLIEENMTLEKKKNDVEINLSESDSDLNNINVLAHYDNGHITTDTSSIDDKHDIKLESENIL